MDEITGRKRELGLKLMNELTAKTNLREKLAAGSRPDSLIDHNVKDGAK